MRPELQRWPESSDVGDLPVRITRGKTMGLNFLGLRLGTRRRKPIDVRLPSVTSSWDNTRSMPEQGSPNLAPVPIVSGSDDTGGIVDGQLAFVAAARRRSKKSAPKQAIRNLAPVAKIDESDATVAVMTTNNAAVAFLADLRHADWPKRQVFTWREIYQYYLRLVQERGWPHQSEKQLSKHLHDLGCSSQQVDRRSHGQGRPRILVWTANAEVPAPTSFRVNPNHLESIFHEYPRVPKKARPRVASARVSARDQQVTRECAQQSEAVIGWPPQRDRSPSERPVAASVKRKFMPTTPRPPFAWSGARGRSQRTAVVNLEEQLGRRAVAEPNRALVGAREQDLDSLPTGSARPEVGHVERQAAPVGNSDLSLDVHGIEPHDRMREGHAAGKQEPNRRGSPPGLSRTFELEARITRLQNSIVADDRGGVVVSGEVKGTFAILVQVDLVRTPPLTRPGQDGSREMWNDNRRREYRLGLA